MTNTTITATLTFESFAEAEAARLALARFAADLRWGPADRAAEAAALARAAKTLYEAARPYQPKGW